MYIIFLHYNTIGVRYLSDVDALGLGGPRDDARDSQPRVAGVGEVGWVHHHD